MGLRTTEHPFMSWQNELPRSAIGKVLKRELRDGYRGKALS